MASLGSVNLYIGDLERRVQNYVVQEPDLSNIDLLSALEIEANSYNHLNGNEIQRLSWIKGQLQQVRETLNVMALSAPQPPVPRPVALPPVIRGTINQFAVKNGQGMTLGTSACVSQACQGLLTLSSSFRNHTPIDSGRIDQSIQDGGQRHLAALAQLKEPDGENLMIDQVEKAGQFPELVFAAERDKQIPATRQEAREINRRMLEELAQGAEATGIAMAVMIHGPEGSSLMARKLPDGTLQFHHYDSHADTTARPVSNLAYIKSASLADMAVYLEQRYPFDAECPPQEYINTGFGIQMNPNAVEVRFVKLAGGSEAPDEEKQAPRRIAPAPKPAGNKNNCNVM